MEVLFRFSVRIVAYDRCDFELNMQLLNMQFVSGKGVTKFTGGEEGRN